MRPYVACSSAHKMRPKARKYLADKKAKHRLEQNLRILRLLDDCRNAEEFDEICDLIAERPHQNWDRLLNLANDLEFQGLDPYLRPIDLSDHDTNHMMNTEVTAWLTSHGSNDILDESPSRVYAISPLGHPKHVLACTNPGFSLATPNKRKIDDLFLSESLRLEREALASCPSGVPQRLLPGGELVSSLWRRYESSGDYGPLEEEIRIGRWTLTEIRPQGHPDRARCCVNLAESLREYSLRTGNHSHLVEATDLLTEALELCPTGNSDHAWTCGSLARTVYLTYIRSDHKDPELLARAHDLLQQALSVTPKPQTWQIACDLSRIYLNTNTPFYDTAKAIDYLSRSVGCEPDNIVAAVNSCSLTLDELRSHDLTTSHRLALISIYQRLADIFTLLINPLLSFENQLQQLKCCGRIAADAFLNAVAAGNGVQGLEALETARGVIWAQRFHQRNPQLQDVPKVLATELQQLLKRIPRQVAAQRHATPSRALTLQDALGDDTPRMYALLREIRGLPGLDRFMLGQRSEILCTVAERHPVVVLVEARGYFHALILGSQGGDTTLRLDLTENDMKSVYNFMTATPNSHRGTQVIDTMQLATSDHSYRALRPPKPSSPLNQLLKSVWLKIVAPVIASLGIQASSGNDRPRLYWCSTGMFTPLPLHAAGIYDGPAGQRRCCADYIVSSYTPTLTTLLRAQRAFTPIARDAVALAMVAEKRAQDRHMPTIPGVDVELSHISDAATSSNVQIVYQQSGQTTLASVSTAIKAANIVHLACHGIQDKENSTQSGFCLGDGRMTILDLMQLHIKDGCLAFLSACETATGDAEEPDQAMHLASAMMFAGFKSVVASMWAVSDKDGPQVAQWFYEELFAQDIIRPDAVAHALDAAVGKLRLAGAPLEQWAPYIHMGA